MNHDTYPDLFWAYSAIWVMITLYMVYLGVRLHRLEKRMQSNEQEGQ